MQLFTSTIRLAVPALACAVAVAALTPAAAQAWWAPPAVVVVAPRPVLPPRIVYVPGPRVVYAPYPRAHWVRPHYDWRGVFIPGHWV
jgi:hypothetical protein